jgi:hypothetical protein
VGFTRLTPENSKATWIAGVVTFVGGGALVFIVGVALALSALGVMPFSWEQAALAVIGAALVAVGLIVSRRSPFPRA